MTQPRTYRDYCRPSAPIRRTVKRAGDLELLGADRPLYRYSPSSEQPQ